MLVSNHVLLVGEDLEAPWSLGQEFPVAEAGFLAVCAAGRRPTSVGVGALWLRRNGRRKLSSVVMLLHVY